VAIDAITVVVNPANDFVDCLTVNQLHEAFKTGGATKWSDIDPTFPDEEIIFYYPGTDSGTFDYFVEQVITNPDNLATHRGDGTSSEDDNVIAQGVEGDAGAIGYFGVAYYLEAGKSLKAVAVDQHADGNCVEPSYETALDGTYEPLSRPLFIYTRAKSLKERPEVLGFVNFYLERVPTLVPEVGYVDMPEALLQEQIAEIEPFLP
jgi:phosphate transport system substrate-binding protein